MPDLWTEVAKWIAIGGGPVVFVDIWRKIRSGSAEDDEEPVRLAKLIQEASAAAVKLAVDDVARVRAELNEVSLKLDAVEERAALQAIELRRIRTREALIGRLLGRIYTGVVDGTIPPIPPDWEREYQKIAENP